MEALLTLAIILYGVTALLLGFLSYAYAKTAISTKARYPLGLFVFSLLLLVQSAGTAMGYATTSGWIGEQAYPFMFTMATFELVGVAILLKITL